MYRIISFFLTILRDLRIHKALWDLWYEEMKVQLQNMFINTFV